MKARLTTLAAALALLAPAATLVTLPQAAAARTRHYAPAPAPEVTAMSVNSDEGLQRGADLNFTLQGTPNGRASVSFSRITLPLKETSAGFYTGTYTVRSRDRIDPTQNITARLTSGRLTSTHNYTWPPSFQALAMGAAPAAVAPNPAGAPAPVVRVENFRMWPGGRIEPGRELHFVVQGAPGATATVDIPGVQRDIALREVSPGRYEGTYTVRQRDDLNAFANAEAVLHSGAQYARTRVAMPRDNEPPSIGMLTPRPGERISAEGNALVAGTFDDHGGRGVDPASVRIMLSGRDVTPQARITSHDFSYRSDLPPGRYTAEVTARDYAGNAVNRSWNFEVGGDRFGAAGSGGPLTLAVNSPANNATIDANGNLSISGRTAPFARVTVKVEAVAPVFGNRFGVAQPVATETIQADRDGYFSLNVSPRALPIPGTRYEVAVTANHNAQTAEQHVTVYTRQG